MWAHYACVHTGVCVGFDTMALVNHFEGIENHNLQFMIGNVIYQEQYPDLNADAWTSEDTAAFVLTKSIEWGYEREYRILFAKEPSADFQRAHAVPSKAITEVVIGCRTPPAARREVLRAVEMSAPKAVVFEATQATDRFALSISKL